MKLFGEALIWGTGAAFIFWFGVYVTLAVLGR